MPMLEEDAELLRRYSEKKSEEAFAELVRRHVDLVYAVALRQVGGDAHLAEDVAQVVFTALARKAGALARRPVLGGWLYRAAQFAAIDVVRAESRRNARETEALTMHEFTTDGGAEQPWEKLRPELDRVMGELGEDDRDAVVLRFFNGCSFGEIGAKLRLSENTARMRVERALEKMHVLLARRGVTSTAAALGLALANQAGVAAPAGLAAAITGVALAGSAASTGGALAVFMSIGKLQVGIVGALAVAGVIGYELQAETNAGLRREIAEAHQQQAVAEALRSDNRQLANQAAEVELLRRDDEELKQLAEAVAAVKKVADENAKRALARSNAQAVLDQIERMNQEGNALVGEFKALTEKARDPALSAEAKAELENAAQQKMQAIRAKKQEVDAFTASARASGAIDGSPIPVRRTAKELAARAEVARLMEEAKAIGTGYNALVEKSQNPALSLAERQEAGVAAQAKMAAAKAKVGEAQAFSRSAEAGGILPQSVEGTFILKPGAPPSDRPQIGAAPDSRP